MAKQVLILLSVMAGFFLMPKFTYACGSNPGTTAETAYCKEGKVCDKENISCCAEHSKKDADDDCGGQCNHTSCQCPSVTATASPYNEGVKHFIFATGKKISYFPHFVLSSGFHSIWQPPKIS